MLNDEDRAIFDRLPFAHVATIGPEGPQVTPVWVELHEGEPRFSTVKGRAKHRNMERDPRVALSILDPHDPYHYVQIRGTVTMADDPDKLLIARLNEKYTGRVGWTKDAPDAERVIVTVHPY